MYHSWFPLHFSIMVCLHSKTAFYLITLFLSQLKDHHPCGKKPCISITWRDIRWRVYREDGGRTNSMSRKERKTCRSHYHTYEHKTAYCSIQYMILEPQTKIADFYATFKMWSIANLTMTVKTQTLQWNAHWRDILVFILHWTTLPIFIANLHSNPTLLISEITLKTYTSKPTEFVQYMHRCYNAHRIQAALKWSSIIHSGVHIQLEQNLRVTFQFAILSPVIKTLPISISNLH